MKVSILTVVVLLELSAHIHGSCDIAGNQLSCTEFNDNFLAYSNEYENVTYVRLSGDFTEIGFDSRFIKLSTVYINSESLVNFNMNNLNNLTSLKSVYEMSNHNMTVDLNVTGDSDTFKNLERLEFSRVQNILGNFTIFVNLEYINIYQYEKEYFDFSLLPNSLGHLGIWPSREVKLETKLVNEISLKRLPYLTQLHLSQATLNASFIPSSLQVLSIKNLTSQENLVNTMITSLNMYYSQTPLEFIPSNLRFLLLEGDSELSANCELFQHSKVDYLMLVNKKRSLALKCLPNITILYMSQVQSPLEFIPTNLRSLSLLYPVLNVTCEHLEQSKLDYLYTNYLPDSLDMNCLPKNLTRLDFYRSQIENINLKPLISHRYIKVMYLYNYINCTCETFRDFIQIVRKQQTDVLQFSCATSSLLSGYNFDHAYNATASIIKLQDYNQRHQNCALVKVDKSEPVTSRAEVTTESNVVTTSASPRITSNVSASIVSAVASFLFLIVVTSK